MNGHCGWVGPETSEETARARCALMVRRLAPDGPEAAWTRTTSRSALARAGGRAEVDWALDGEVSLVCCGEPELDGARPPDAAAGLVRAYRDCGAALLGRLGGEFSLAVLDHAAGTALLAIDRVGGRCPLYYRLTGDGLVFGTSADAVVAAARSEIDPQALYNYLLFYVVPGPGTAWRDVSKLLPGQYLAFSSRATRVERYWEPNYEEDRARPLADRVAEFRDLLKRSVARASRDGSVHCFLSGGTDSSTLVGTVSEITGGAARAYSIGFEAAGYDEMRFARIAAARFGAVHREYYLRPEDIVRLIPWIAATYSEPFGNESAVPSYHCARLAREDGAEVMLGGDGGDELFGGNERYARQTVFELYTRLPPSVRRRVLEPLAFGFPGKHLPPLGKLRSYIQQARVPMPERAQAYALLQRLGPDQVLEPDFLGAVDPEAPLVWLREVYGGAKARTMLNRFLALDLRLTLADNDLPKVARMGERAGVRVRFPFLSDEMLQFSFRLPSELKLRRLQLRWFFKHALRDFLPREILRKPKHGMGTPFGIWLREHARLREIVDDSLADLRSRAIVRPAFLERLIRLHRDEHAAYYGVPIWVLVQLEQWLKAHVDARPG